MRGKGKHHHGGRIHGGRKAAAIIDADWDDQGIDNIQGGQGALTNETAALTMANGHPKSGIPEPGFRPGGALDETDQRRGNALPIGAFQS